ncbi:MAG TPA: transglutaminase domain-containing protein [Flavipsychrobacter sp.]|nr:transglutaminase domain-containing protein [Flavipsychrobacter sp.]
MRKVYLVIITALSSLTCTTISAQVDSTIGTNVSGGATNNYKTLAHALCDGLPSDRQKANAIYNWITHNIKYDVKALKKTSLEPDKVEKVLKRRKAVCDGYSKLFTALCDEAGLKAVTIDGYAKDWMFDNGDQMYIPRHAWNAVYVEGKWHLVEATWGAGHLTQEPGWFKKLFGGKKNPFATGKLKFKFDYDPTHFLMDPLTFRKTHLPTDPLWQLTDSMMPITVFEAGDSAIDKFNSKYSVLVENLPELDRINKLDEWKRSQETAKRITDFNPRFRVEMAFKYHADALDSLSTALVNKSTSFQALVSAKDELKKAEKEIATQKSTISTEYSVLKKKNKTKNLDAKEHIRKLTSDNKSQMAACKSRINSANNRFKAVVNKEKAAVKKNNLLLTAKPGTAVKLKEEDATTPGLMTIESAVDKGNARIQELKQIIDDKKKLIEATQKQNDKRLDSLALSFRVCDSALVKETIARLNMHDNYDDEVIKWNSIVKKTRLNDLDTLQKYFFAGYDSTLIYYESARASHWEQLEQYRKNFKEIEKYKRRNTKNTAFLSQYNAMVNEYNNSNEAYMQLLSDFASYIQENKSIFTNVVNLYKRQEKLVEYMKKSEDTRKKLEEENLAKKEAFDKKENEKQRNAIKATTKKIEKVLAVK